MKKQIKTAGGKRKKKRHFFRKSAAAAAVVCAAGAVYAGYGQELLNRPQETETAVYQTETVKYGAVSSGISESGTVAYGTLEQTFETSDIVSVSSSSDNTSTSAAASSASSMGGTMNLGAGTAVTMGSSASASGSTVSSDSTAVSLVVEEVYVSPGQVVAQGDALLKLTDESVAEYQEALESAVTSAQLLVRQEEINVESKQAEADYTYNMYLAEGETAQETYEATITSLENEVADLEEALAESAEAIAEYEEELAAGSDVEEELEEEELNYSTIEANLQIARNNLTTGTIEAKQTYDNAMTNYKYAEELYAIDTDGLEDDLNEAQDTLEEAQEALTEFQEQIGDGTIYSEYTGTLTSVSYAAGDTITSGQTVAAFVDSAAVSMTVQVSQEDIANVATGQEVSITLTAYPEEAFSGEVSSIATSATTGSATVNYQVEVLFTGDTEKVYADMTGEVQFVEREETEVLYISNKAVHQDGADSYVKVQKDDGTIEEVSIVTGFSNGSIVEVVSGLEQGQTVLIESQVTG